MIQMVFVDVTPFYILSLNFSSSEFCFGIKRAFFFLISNTRFFLRELQIFALFVHTAWRIICLFFRKN